MANPDPLGIYLVEKRMRPCPIPRDNTNDIVPPEKGYQGFKSFSSTSKLFKHEDKSRR
jgi:hypothetical protein